MNLIAWLNKQLDAGWFSRILVLSQFWLAFWLVDWSMAFASTALAAMVQGPPDGARRVIDLLSVAATITAVAAVPQGLLMLATNAYMQMRGKPA